MPDTRYCYGATCTWHGPIQNVINSGGIPGCPHCGGPLYQMYSKKQWDSMAKKFEKEQNLPFYSTWLEHSNKCKCVPLKDWNWYHDYEKFVEGMNKNASLT